MLEREFNSEPGFDIHRLNDSCTVQLYNVKNDYRLLLDSQNLADTGRWLAVCLVVSQCHRW